MEERILRILLVEDDEDDYVVTRDILAEIRGARFELEWASTYAAGLQSIGRKMHDVYLLDYRLGEQTGLNLLREAIASGCKSPVILLTGQDDRDTDLEAMRAGAADYFVKGLINAPLLERSIRYALERKRVEDELYQSESRYRKLVELSPDGIAIHSNGRLRYINPAGAKMLGASSGEELTGKPLLDFIHPDFQETAIARLRQLDEGVEIPWLEEMFIRLDATVIDVEIAAVPFVFDGKQAVQSIFRDITERKLAKQHLEQLAHFDPLTGLPNRALFFDRLVQALLLAKRYNHLLALLFIDLDRFKAINDTLGHDAGDLVLKETAKRLTSAVRCSDTVARMGGDEFTVILPRINSVAEAQLVIAKIAAAVEAPMVVHDCTRSIGASIGLSIYPTDGDDAELLLKKADCAMYCAKEQRGRVAQ